MVNGAGPGWRGACILMGKSDVEAESHLGGPSALWGIKTGHMLEGDWLWPERQLEEVTFSLRPTCHWQGLRAVKEGR